jgi:hypothetical protein
METLLEILRGATEEQRAEICGVLGIRTGPVAASSKKATTGSAKRKTAVPAVPLPDPTEDGAPSADSYRLKEDDIDYTVCVGRVLSEDPTCKDRRWKPAIYRESQCSAEVDGECDLCKTCQRRLEKYAEDPKPGAWTGRVTEDPPGWVHMLDTEWAEAKKPKWMGVETGTEASADASEAVSKTSAAEAKKAAAEAKKAEAEAKKSAAAEAKKAAAEAKKSAAEAKKAEAEAKKAEAAAAKKAAAEAKKAATPAKKSAAAATPKVAAGGAGAVASDPTPAPAKADTSAEVSTVEGRLEFIEGDIYMIRGKNVYKYDEESEATGEYVGLLTADETIDHDAPEEEI